MKKIPFAKPYIGAEEKAAIGELIDSGNIGQGERVAEFEARFADYVGSKYAVATDSCTSALFLSLKASGLGRDHDIMVPSLSFTASAAVIKYVGANVVFGDVKKDNFCLKVSELDNPRGVINVHLTGNVNKIETSAIVIDDSAHLLERGCYQGNIQCFSFHPTKSITTGFGGMIALNDKAKVDWLHKARLHGCYKHEWSEGMTHGSARWGYSVDFCGWKMNMNDMQAVMGIEQLKKLDWMNDERRRCVERYNEKLHLKRKGLHLYPVFVRDRDFFMHLTRLAGIQCSVHFKPLHTMPAYSDVTLENELPITNWVGEHIVSLPLFPELTNDQIDYICHEIKKTNLLISQ